MKISKIIVNKLFGIFDHVIPLNPTSGITIIIGENGLGKTVILESIKAFFGGNFQFFVNVEFEKLTFYFDNDEIWEIDRKEEGESKISLYVTRWFVGKENDRTKTIKFFETGNNQGGQPEFDSISRSRWLRDREFETFFLSRDQRINPDHQSDLERIRAARDLELLHIRMSDRNRVNTRKDGMPAWFRTGLKRVTIKIIETQRLITAKERGGDAYINTVRKFSDDLIARISSTEKTAGEISTQLDSSYPNRLMQKLRQKAVDTYEDLNLALSMLDEKRKLLSAVGLIENISQSDLLRMEESETGLFNPLKLYIDDSHQKLAPYGDLSIKVKLFQDILNKRFKHKNIEIHRKTGFVFRSRVKKNENGIFETIPLEKLSSGEQNELIMFYELIFNTKIGDMIFIDEPELSLHISWQNQFINDLKEVTSMNSVAVVIATHSPDIIDKNWDLRVELEGLE